jgi:hypothetical protein
MATAAPATAELCMLEAPPVQMGNVAVDAGGAGGGTTVEVGGGGGAVVVQTMMGVGGTTVVVQGVMMVTVASLQVVSGSSHLVHGMVVVHPTVTHSVAEQVIVVVHQSQTGRVVGW